MNRLEGIRARLADADIIDIRDLLAVADAASEFIVEYDRPSWGSAFVKAVCGLRQKLLPLLEEVSDG